MCDNTHSYKFIYKFSRFSIAHYIYPIKDINYLNIPAIISAGCITKMKNKIINIVIVIFIIIDGMCLVFIVA